jgi:hypothetical protein
LGRQRTAVDAFDLPAVLATTLPRVLALGFLDALIEADIDFETLFSCSDKMQCNFFFEKKVAISPKNLLISRED